MSEFVAFPDGEDGSALLVEVVAADGGPVTRGRTGAGDIVVRAEESLGSVLGRIGPAMQGIVGQLRSNADWPDEVTVEFAVRISADSNVIIARTGGEANFKIAARWNKPKAE